MPRALTHPPVEAGARASIRLPDYQPLTLLLVVAPAGVALIGLVASASGLIASPGHFFVIVILPALISVILAIGRRRPAAG